METLEKLEIKSKNLELALEEANITLKIILEHRDLEKKNTEKNILENINMRVLPFVNKLKYYPLSESQNALLNIIETNLSEIIGPFSSQLPNKANYLSPTELRVAKMVKDGKTAKEIAEIMQISSNTVREHKINIRKKFGLKGKKVNLRNYIQSIFQE